MLKFTLALVAALNFSVVAAAATPIGSNTTATPAASTNNYADAYKDTLASGKPLIILVGASWCPACQSMKTSVMPSVAAQGKLENVAFAYVNTDAQSDLATKLMVGNTIPQLVRYDKTADGWKLTRLVGGQSVSTVVQFVAAAEKPAVAKSATAGNSTANPTESAAKPKSTTATPGDRNAAASASARTFDPISKQN